MAGRLTDEEHADRRMTEAQLDSRVKYRARKRGWKVLHIQRALVGAGTWRTGASKGFPDLLLVRADEGEDGVLFRELKRELGKTSPEQDEWIALLHAAGANVGVWRPSDLRLGRVEVELA